MKLRWDIFCTVIDNYGDIGVSWRLARQLAEEFGQDVRLWVDDLESFSRMEPRLDAKADAQPIAGVEIRRWQSIPPEVEPAQVVIEALACRLPESYLQKMATMTVKPVWINLEYLSAEDWVAECHGLASPHPRLPLRQTFFIPGFGPGTGGLPGSSCQREKLAAWRRQPGERARFLAERGIETAAEDTLLVSVFAYDNAAIRGLLDALSEFSRPVVLAVPEGKVCGQIASWLGLGNLHLGHNVHRGHLAVCPLPFLPLDDYDRLVWSCDLNCVRGEDSFVQAQWAARPLIWQPYVQEDGAHWNKLRAFAAKYVQGLDPETAGVLEEAWRVWNAGENHPAIWRAYLAKLPKLSSHAKQWEARLRIWPSLANELIKFVRANI